MNGKHKNVTVCSITDKKFHVGTGVLINSLIRSGFRGKIYIAYFGSRPSWESQAKHLLKSHGVEIEFVGIDINILPHYAKPIIIKYAMERGANPVFYIDSDIIVMQGWDFFLRWIDQGVALAGDVSFEFMSPNHPMRSYWRDLIAELGLQERDVVGYANSGFIGLTNEYSEIIDVWDRMIQYYGSRRGGLDKKPKREPGFITIDQDLLNAAMMATKVPLSLVGPEGMSFRKSVGYMVHPVGTRKPWKKGYLKDLILYGKGMHFAARCHWSHVNGPLILETRLSRTLARIEMDATALLSRLIGSQ